MNLWKRAWAMLVSAVLLCSVLVLPAAAAGTQRMTKYKTVFVHGMLGWGSYGYLSNVVDYWGAGTGSILDDLTRQGYDVYGASVGPISSSWDRACELYAQITGTRVDYGAAHSAKCGHERYGRSYKGKALIPNFKWNSKNKINLVGHSFGGTTIRRLLDLLADGSAEEVAACKKNGTKVSPLFTGGKGGYVASVTTVASPINGSTQSDMPEGNLDAFLLGDLPVFGADLLGSVNAQLFHDFQLEHFGICRKDGETPVQALTRILTETDFMDHNDSCYADMHLNRAFDLNREFQMVPGVYYISYNCCTTTMSGGAAVPKAGTLVFMQRTARNIGRYAFTTPSSYPMYYGSAKKTVTVTPYKVDSSWFMSDGLVNVKSAKYPIYRTAGGAFRTMPHKTYRGKLQAGVWNVMPQWPTDHLGAVGGVFSEDPATVHGRYLDMMNVIAQVG